MGNKNHDLHILFFPFLANGHIIPCIDLARVFVNRGTKATIVTTNLNVPLISRTIGKANINIRTIRFPSPEETGLPEGCENSESALAPDKFIKFMKSTLLLREPLEKVLEEERPDCIIADMFFPWATDSAAKFNIPRIVFHGLGFFPLCVLACVRQYKPQDKVSSYSEPFVVPNLPGEITLTKMQLPQVPQHDKVFSQLLEESNDSEVKSYGVIANSFYELEPVYADHYRNELGRRAWHLGPVSLCKRDREEKALRGREAAIDGHECLKWLENKETNSVVYVCFGSMTSFPDVQLKEIAMGLEASGQPFIWVVKKGSKSEDEKLEWLPEGFEERIEGKGLIIRGWAPQVMILEHEAIGGFVTHCGWNSTLEGVCAGLPMVTWPMYGEQFYNAKFLSDVVKIGVGVGVETWIGIIGREPVKKDAIEKAVKRVMVGEEAEQMRKRAKELGEKARRAVEEGGSSYIDFDSLINDLRSLAN
ncbi:PREDICTED: UDP-glucose flavonoid 3-O-glucosyltransferase 7-like [Lupinus angustifolius]|uniref:UDP-glucose flavonoid 3-O-glucosyltransferase 7-like n=1 Tax=Lupinus angustifolius TaxID=3871 RepID=UPI00092FCC9D|nr:PREDICTED: UDP-glucose flavonoid 3-O-glucosyltransferase 7-like [Lupinus angustifolius]